VPVALPDHHIDEAPFPVLQVSVLAQVVAWTVNKGVELLPRQDNYPFGRNFAPLVYHGDLIDDLRSCEPMGIKSL
jgi:hypothetical protein